MKKILVYLSLVVAGCQSSEDKFQTMFPGKPGLPASIQQEHDSLLAMIGALAQQPDSAGRAAKKLSDLLVHHFAEEEDYLLPPLSILPQLANGEMPQAAAGIIDLNKKFRGQMAYMTAEHQLVEANLAELSGSPGARQLEVNRFTAALLQHAQREEEVYFPAALLAGEYLALRLNRQQAASRNAISAGLAD